MALVDPAAFGNCQLCGFFSSRRRHTRCSRDWSSDVCSSDLPPYVAGGRRPQPLWRPSATERSPAAPWRDRRRPRSPARYDSPSVSGAMGKIKVLAGDFTGDGRYADGRITLRPTEQPSPAHRMVVRDFFASVDVAAQHNVVKG